MKATTKKTTRSTRSGAVKAASANPGRPAQATATGKHIMLSESLQRNVVVLIVFAFLLNNAVLGLEILEAYDADPTLNSFWTAIAASFVVPAAMFAYAFLLNPRNLHRLGRIFESIIWTLAGVAMLTIIELITTRLLWRFAVPSAQAIHTFYEQQMWVLATAFILYAGILYYLRVKRRWW